MLLIECPWCGPRAQTEFSYGGEAYIARPVDTDALSDAQWADYLFMRTNSRGPHSEQWVHTYGCRRWFNVRRDTVTYAFLDGEESKAGPMEKRRGGSSATS
jgi:sarcosine oxidase subunit delta